MTMKLLQYSVLISVYAKEKAEYFERSIVSVLEQTVATDDFVIICDGALTVELDKVIDKYSDSLNVVRLPKIGDWVPR